MGPSNHQLGTTEAPKINDEFGSWTPTITRLGLFGLPGFGMTQTPDGMLLQKLRTSRAFNRFHAFHLFCLPWIFSPTAALNDINVHFVVASITPVEGYAFVENRELCDQSIV